LKGLNSVSEFGSGFMPDIYHSQALEQPAAASFGDTCRHKHAGQEPAEVFGNKADNAALREGEEKYRSLYLNTPVMMHSIDREGRLLSVSKCWLESLGYEESEVLGRKSVEFLTPESRKYAEEIVLPEYFKKGACKNVPYQFVKKNGELIDVLLSAIAEFDADGGLVRSLAVLNDVTAQKRTQEALLRSEEQAKAQYKGFPIPTYTWQRRQNGEFVLVEFNEAARIFTEGRIARLLGTTAEELYPDEPAIKGEISRCYSQRGCIRREMLYQLRTTHESKYLDVTYVFVPPDLVMIHCEDITERKQAEEALKKSKLELEQRVRERTRSLEQSIKSLEGLLYHVAHDLRAPLRSMHSFTELLLEDYAHGLDATGEKYAQIISEASAKMDFLIRDLLSFGRLGHQNVSWTYIDLTALLERVLAGLRREGPGAVAEIHLEGPLPKVWGDPHILEQVLVNLISNGFKFISRGTIPRLRIWAEAGPESTVRLHIRDNGIGIAPEYHERIFRVFERLHSIESDYPGTGIGLAIVKKGMERLEGHVGVESNLGEGSCFWLELKAHAP
jgi:PAS domain S-box-containing protein